MQPQPAAINAPLRSEGRTRAKSDQFAFDFESAVRPGAENATSSVAVGRQLSIAQQVQAVASDYQLQMQAYALAVKELMPSSASREIASE